MLWLNSKGMLTIADQQFGPWIRAPQFNPVRRAVVELQGFEHTASLVTVTQNNTKSSQGSFELVGYEIGIISMVDLVDSPMPTHMETEEHGGRASDGVDHAGSGGSLSQSQNYDTLNGGIGGNINSEAVTLGHKTI